MSMNSLVLGSNTRLDSGVVAVGSALVGLQETHTRDHKGVETKLKQIMTSKPRIVAT